MLLDVVSLPLNRVITFVCFSFRYWHFYSA